MQHRESTACEAPQAVSQHQGDQQQLQRPGGRAWGLWRGLLASFPSWDLQCPPAGSEQGHSSTARHSNGSNMAVGCSMMHMSRAEVLAYHTMHFEHTTQWLASQGSWDM